MLLARIHNPASGSNLVTLQLPNHTYRVKGMDGCYQCGIS